MSRRRRPPAPRPGKPVRSGARAPVARLRTPADLVAAVPLLCGYVPQESLVVLSLHGSGTTLGLTMRFDLGWSPDVADAAAEVVARLRHDGARSAVVLVHSDQPDVAGERAWGDLVTAVEVECDAAGIAVPEALLVRDGRWWSYTCSQPTCCPAEGTPFAAVPSASVQLLQAQNALDGRAALETRQQVVRSVAPPVLLAARAADQRAERALEAWAERRCRDGVEAARAADVRTVREAVDRVASAEGLDPERATLVALAVQDVVVRDEVATWALTEPAALLSLLQQTAQQVVPPEDAAVCVLLAWVAYAHGDGGLANVALERGLRSDPDHSLGLLLRQALEGQLHPREVRRILERTSTRPARPLRTPG
jgi:hypothetical protein